MRHGRDRLNQLTDVSQQLQWPGKKNKSKHVRCQIILVWLNFKKCKQKVPGCWIEYETVEESQAAPDLG
jgi:hypothetical protein